MVNLVVDESRSQSLSCGGQSASLASLWTDGNDNRGSMAALSASGTVVGPSINDTLHRSQGGVRVKDIRCMASGATDDRRDLLASIAVSAQTLLTLVSVR